MTNKQLRVVASVWAAIEAEEDDISTERLFAMTCDRASDQLGVTVDNSDVTDAVKKFIAVAPVESRSGS